MSPSLLLLPNETLLEILEALGCRDILACQATCRRLWTLITDSILLQYEIELFACGMLDGARGLHTLDVQDRLDRLKRHSVAWEQLRWSGCVPLPHLVGCGTPVAVSRDVLVLPHAKPMPIMVSAACVQQVPSQLRGIDEYHSSYAIPEFSLVYAVQIDTAQDLITFRRYNINPLISTNRIHMCSLMTGEAHPLAYTLDVMDTVTPEARGNDIYGDLLLEVVRTRGTTGTARLVLRNWKTGLIEAERMAPQACLLRSIFLDEWHILSLMLNGNDKYTASLWVASLSPASNTHAAPYVFSFPEFLHDYVDGAYLYASPLETATPRHGCFYSDPTDRLILIYVSDFRRERFFIDIPTCTFQRYIKAHPPM
ncbi:hypothetical protein BV25DRAFT_1916870 [Artomyces pyxidatus]|uniref:Uncharacterized protein n=1 Tax=Artomyces pyxidatus TaxID=48021 RepID=A0ACB8SY43_9AGAM|nr:hypothetical protein BV25DRAFT_1916870 [Artomyces pyxidatus]